MDSDAEDLLKSTETTTDPASPLPDDRWTAVTPAEASSAISEAGLAAAGALAASLTEVSPPVGAVALPARYRGRSPERRSELAVSRGGSLETEAAVQAALAWLAASQDRQDGRWQTSVWGGGREIREFADQDRAIRADNAVTGLALLAFLGAGQTHFSGDYQEAVRRGLQFLLDSQAAGSGSLAGDASRYTAMYCHGIATLALSEALIMTNDPRLRPALERAIGFTLRSQHPTTGGWRYQAGDWGDTSQLGWQVMALVSAQAAGVPIQERVWRGADRWLDRVALGEYGGLACYTPDRRLPSASMTAEAMVCRAFLGNRTGSPAQTEAADYVARHGTRPDSTQDLYFAYYATLALYPLQDERWTAWNQRLTSDLLREQQSQGQLAGSWDPTTKWGATGGRVYTTAMACLCLETYYRYLPVFELAASGSHSPRRR